MGKGAVRPLTYPSANNQARMDVLTFIVELLNALAWPTAVVLSVLLVRRYIASLVPRITQLKYGDLDVTFKREVAEAAVLSESVEVAPMTEGEREEEFKERSKLLNLASQSPKIAVQESWRRLDHRLIEVGKSVDLDVAPAVWSMPMVLSGMLRANGNISMTQFGMILKLKQLYDKLKDEPDAVLPEEEAIRYVDLALLLTASIKKKVGGAA